MVRLPPANGFTLIEMSIVLVVVAFIISGVIGSHVLVRQSQVRSIMTDEQTYVKAAQNFQQKYAALPGDMSNATTYWGSLASNGLACRLFPAA